MLASDGDLMEGISQEAIALAGHLRLNKLIVLFDDNGISIDGALSLSDSVDQVKRFEAAGWAATRVDGHDPEAIAAAIAAAQASDRPSLIACRTTIGFGAPKQGRHREKPRRAARRRGDRRRAQGARLERRRPSRFPPTSATHWRTAGPRARRALHQAWEQAARKRSTADKRAEFERRMAGEIAARNASPRRCAR